MKQDEEPDEQFWDITTVTLTLLLLAVIAFIAFAIWPLEHPGGREP